MRFRARRGRAACGGQHGELNTGSWVLLLL